MKRKMVSASSSRSQRRSSQQQPVVISTAWPTRKRALGGLFVWAKVVTMLGNTPAACISRCSCSPSRKCSPMPQKIPTPSWWPISLWTILVSSTGLPTSAPPNRPASPPCASGVSTSIAWMPGSKISDWVKRRSSAGGARCAESHSALASAGPQPTVSAKRVKHARKHRLPHRRPERSAGLLQRYAERQALGGHDRHAAHMPRIALGQPRSPPAHPARPREGREQRAAGRQSACPRHCRRPPRRPRCVVLWVMDS